MYATSTQFLATTLEALLDEEAHALQGGTSLLHQVDDAIGRIAIGQEVIDEQHMVVLSEIVAADTYRIGGVLGE